MLPGNIHAIENCSHCNRGLTTLSDEANVRFIVLLSLFDLTQGRIRGGKAGSAVLKYYLDPAAWVLPGKINAMKNCAHCHRGLTTLSGEVNARFIVLLSLFDCKQGRVRGGKAGDSPKISPRFGGVGASRQDKRNEKLCSLSLGAYHTVG